MTTSTPDNRATSRPKSRAKSGALSAEQRRAMRAVAHSLKPVVMIGAEGLTPAVMFEIDRALVAHELIKVRVFGDDRDARVAMYDSICAETGCQPIQMIGKLLVLYRERPEQADDVTAMTGQRRSAAKPARGHRPKRTQQD